MIRFAIPLVTIGTDVLTQKYLMAEYNQNQKVIDGAPKKVNEYKQLATKVPKTGLAAVSDTLNNYLLKAKEVVDIESHYKRLQLAAEQWAKILLI